MVSQVHEVSTLVENSQVSFANHPQLGLTELLAGIIIWYFHGKMCLRGEFEMQTHLEMRSFYLKNNFL